MPTTPAERVEAARKFAKVHGLVYVPCYQKFVDGPNKGQFMPNALDAPIAIKLLICARHVPPDTIERWWKGERLEELRLSLCAYCRCNPVANAIGTCWWCELRPWKCQPDPLSSLSLPDFSPGAAAA